MTEPNPSPTPPPPGIQAPTHVAEDASSPPTAVTGGGLSQTPAAPAYAAPLRPPPTWLGRYEVYEEIARGGMGSVLRARDPELNRDLAVKVLRPGLAEHPDLVRRFIEEAQIAAQLPHPGVVPVHDVGRDAHGLPFLVMKLVRGETLEALLDRRAGLTEDLPRFVAIFEQVCQAVAFAHSRRVIHRDLKPANVMVGAFGEVQVMDWGLAKVLPSTSSTPPPHTATPPGEEVATLRKGGSDTQGAMGTPCYMPPEQAGGDWARVDERADVFGLGGILCTILTGAPPYVGNSQEEALGQAVRGDLEAARARLRLCGADPELVALAGDCLCPEAAGRPRDAGEVARRAAVYRAGVEQRLRRAEQERAAAEAREQEAKATARAEQARALAERRARRQTVALAVVLLVLVGGGSAAGWWYQRDRQARALEQTARRAGDTGEVQAAADEVNHLLDQGRTQADDAGRWGTMLDQARAAIRRAEEVTGRGEVSEELAARVRDARQMLTRDEADWGVADALERVRLTYADALGTPGGKATAARGYRKVFEAAGIDPHGDRADVVRRLQGHRLRARLLAALGEWASYTMDPREKEELQAIEEAVAPRSEPWRARLRLALRRQDTRALAELADGAAARGLPPAAMADLGRRLRAAGAPDAAVRLLREGQLRHPDDFWLNQELGMAYYNASPPQPAQAVRYLTAAAALRSGSAAAQVNLGAALKAINDTDAAARCYRRAIELQPKYAPAHVNLGTVFADKNDLQAAILCYRRALELDPTLDTAHWNLGTALCEQGDMQGAAESLRRVVELDPEYALAHYNLGWVLQARGDLAGAVRCYTRSIELDPKFADAHHNLGTALLARGEYVAARDATRHALELLPRRDPKRQIAQEQLRCCEAVLALGDKLPAILEGKARPRGADEAIQLALLCQKHQQLHAAAARLYAEAFGVEPSLVEDVQAGHRYNAACSAALAGCGKGTDAAGLDAAARARWRAQALAWLRADLALLRQRIDKGKPPERAAALQKLAQWLSDPDLAGVRDGRALAALHAQEGDAWKKLWTEVRDIAPR
jgi:serine/threonine-protein kinase